MIERNGAIKRLLGALDREPVRASPAFKVRLAPMLREAMVALTTSVVSEARPKSVEGGAGL